MNPHWGYSIWNCSEVINSNGTYESGNDYTWNESYDFIWL